MSDVAINNLMQMEMALYPHRISTNVNCPSMSNGYMAVPNYNMYNYSPMFRGYGNYNKDIFTQANDATRVNNQYQTAGNGNSQVDWNNPLFKGLTQDDMNNLADYYAKNNVLEEGFAGAAMGGLSWMAFEHAQSVFHPRNAWKGIKEAREIFKSIDPKIDPKFAKENAALLQEANIAVQQTVRDTGRKGWWSKWIRKPLYLEDAKDLKGLDAQALELNAKNKAAVLKELENMKAAIEGKNVEEIARITERLKALRGMDGRIVGIFSKGRSVEERLTDKINKGTIEKGKNALLELNENSHIDFNNNTLNKFGNLVKGSFKKDFLGFMAFETIFNVGKIITAFQKDDKTGVQQAGQSLGKSALGTAGWCLGRAAGTALAAKGAAIGLSAGPVGSLVGALVGFTVGSIGMWAGHKLGNAILGQDVADKVEAQNMTQTKEGQVELLQFAAKKAEEGKTDARTNQIVYKALVANS